MDDHLGTLMPYGAPSTLIIADHDACDESLPESMPADAKLVSLQS
jgi:hypothetical protein